mmetsp:Transcript_54313/g.143015  ORF Transcript_54313/g.143015 Transcript_54313/m.143015 type:complete len:108 (-) Transcript_54313:31-354(-)
MTQLVEQFKDLSLLLFPSGQFGDQEKKTAAEIKAFVASKGLDRPCVHIMEKGDVAGPGASPIWKFLKAQTGAPDPNWNFTGKFLVSRDGAVTVPSKDLKGDVAKLHG